MTVLLLDSFIHKDGRMAYCPLIVFLISQFHGNQYMSYLFVSEIVCMYKTFGAGNPKDVKFFYYG